MTDMIHISTNKDETLRIIRNGLRDKINFIRKQQRDVKMSENRFVLGELTYNGNIEKFVVTTAKNLRKKSLNIQEYRKLQNVLIQSQNYINVFFQVNNVVQGLSRDLSSTSIQSKLAAANCCCNLALGNLKSCITLCKYVAPYLIADLESTNQSLAEVCAWTIGNLVSKSRKVFSILHDQGCTKSLINFVRQSSDKVLPAASYASLRYIYTGIDFIKISDIIKLGEIIVMRYSEVSDINTMWLLAILSSQSECIKDFMKCISIICTDFSKAVFAEDENIQKISAALRIISNIISESSGQVAFYLFANEIEKNRTFLKKLLFHQYIHIRQETLWLLSNEHFYLNSNLYNHCLDSVQQMIKLIIFSLPSLKLAINSFINQEQVF